jgi:hypothetical protein
LEKRDENYVVLQGEIVRVTAKSGDNFTIVRGAGTRPSSDTTYTQGSTPFPFDSNDWVFLLTNAEVVEDIQDEVARLETAKLDITDYQKGEKVYGASSTGNDDYSITLDPPITAYTQGQSFKFMADVANT